jgi:leader peptidase (prepilin peptidase)/N-methyltransferase
VAAVSVLPAVVLGVLGIAVGTAVNRSAARYPWASGASIADVVGPGPRAARPPVLEFVGAAALALVGLRFGWSPDLAAWVWLAAVALLLAVIDLRVQLLPNRVIAPALVISALLLTAAAAVDGRWDELLRAGLGAAVLFAVFLGLALISPRALGMGDVKLAALLGLHLGWLGWHAVVLGAAAGFVVQAALSLVLLATRRLNLRGELPFGPALLLGAAVAVGWSG